MVTRTGSRRTTTALAPAVSTRVIRSRRCHHVAIRGQTTEFSERNERSIWAPAVQWLMRNGLTYRRGRWRMPSDADSDLDSTTASPWWSRSSARRWVRVTLATTADGPSIMHRWSANWASAPRPSNGRPTTLSWRASISMPRWSASRGAPTRACIGPRGGTTRWPATWSSPARCIAPSGTARWST